MIEIPNMRNIDEIKNIDKGQNWKKVSSVIEASTKIYQYRVEANYDEATRIMKNIINDEEKKEI